MKKIIYLLLVLMLVMISVCACDTSQDEANDNNLESQNSKVTNQDEKTNNLSVPSSENNIKETIKEEQKESGNQIIEVAENNEEKVNNKTEEKTESSQSQSISVSATSLSNKTNAWGFVRKKNEVRPEFAAQYTKVLDDYEGIYAGNSEEKVIYLTFDEGYENGYTGAILDTLKEKDCPATFFVTKPYVKQNQELVQRMIDEGHIVGNHTVNHPSMPEVTDDEKLKAEITGLHDYVKELFDYDMEFLRPPKGEYSERTVAISKELGYRTVLWSSAYDDWDVNKQGRLDYARGMILNYVHNGCVMLLHAVSKDNTELLGEVIDEIRNRGYEIRALSEFEY